MTNVLARKVLAVLVALVLGVAPIATTVNRAEVDVAPEVRTLSVKSGDVALKVDAPSGALPAKAKAKP